MRTNSEFTLKWTAVVIALAALIIASVSVGSVFAQGADDAAKVRDRAQIPNTDQDPQGDALQQRIRERIENEAGLQDQERERLRQHLGECKQLGLDDEVLAALFNEQQPLREQIRNQERVLTMARKGIPVEPLTQKIQEGLRKGVNAEKMEQVCERMEMHLQSAHRIMQRLREDGADPGNEDAERRQTREMAMHMWHGLEEGDMEQLRERARLRLRDGSCTTEDFSAAAATASQLNEMGFERRRAVHLAGDALQSGYNAQEMRQLGWMIMTAHMHGGSSEDIIGTVEDGIRNQHQLATMVQEMWQRGWMGPADQHGGHGPMDGSPGSGPGGQQGGNQDQGQGGKGGKGSGGGN
jgi:hypothetical protein